MVAAAWGGAADADVVVLMVEAHRGNVGAAIEAFHDFLETAPAGAERTEAEQMLSKLRRALN